MENSELFKECMGLLGSLSGNVFERRTSTASERFSFSYILTLPKRRFAQEYAQYHSSRVQKFHFRLTCVAQKRRCFNSLLKG